MEIIPIALMATGTLVSAGGAIQEGQAAQAGAEFEAAQMRQQAGQTRASSQRQAIEERRRARLAQSRAQAVAAASGAGATDPTVSNIIGEIEEEGEYRALSALYEGEEKARGLETGAAGRIWEGRQKRKAANIRAATTLLFGGSRVGQSLLDKYGR